MSAFSLGVSENEVIAQFTAFLEANVKPRSILTVVADGNTHRFTIEGDKAGSKNGAYALSLHGRDGNSLANGYVKNWKSGDTFTWHYKPSDDERKEYGRQQHNPEAQAKQAQQRKERERKLAEEKKLQEENEAQAQSMALAEYQNATHFSWLYDDILKVPYLRSKFAGTGISYVDDWQFDAVIDGKKIGYPPKICRGTIEGGICKNGELLIPMQNIKTGTFQTLIRIPSKPDHTGHWPKVYYKGISPKYSAYIIQPQHASNDVIYACEGFATAIATMITLKSRYVVLACGSCNNIAPVCKALRIRQFEGKIIIVADNDNAGIAVAEKCVSTGLVNAYVKPEISGFDWCDWLVSKSTKEDNN